MPSVYAPSSTRWMTGFVLRFLHSLRFIASSPPTHIINSQKKTNHESEGIRRWCMDERFTKRVFTGMMRRVRDGYLERLFKWPNQFGSTRRAASRILEDHVALVAFFARNGDLVDVSLLHVSPPAATAREDHNAGGGGAGGEVKSHFRALEAAAAVLLGDEEVSMEAMVAGGLGVEGALALLQRLRLHAWNQGENGAGETGGLLIANKVMSKSGLLNSRKVRDFDAVRRRWRHLDLTGVRPIEGGNEEEEEDKRGSVQQLHPVLKVTASEMRTLGSAKSLKPFGTEASGTRGWTSRFFSGGARASSGKPSSSSSSAATPSFLSRTFSPASA